MGSKRTSRRELLKGGGALAGGLTLGAVAPALGQTPASDQAPAHDHSMAMGSQDYPMIPGNKGLIAYGERSGRDRAHHLVHDLAVNRYATPQIQGEWARASSLASVGHPRDIVY